MQNARKFEQQIEQAKSKAELVKQEMLAQQNKEKVEADTARIRAVIGAEQEQAVRVTAAQQELEVSRLENEAADFQAEAILRKAEARARRHPAEQRGAGRRAQQRRSQAFGTGMNLARYTFYRKRRPAHRIHPDQRRRPGRPGGTLPALPAGRRRRCSHEAAH